MYSQNKRSFGSSSRGGSSAPRSRFSSGSKPSFRRNFNNQESSNSDSKNYRVERTGIFVRDRRMDPAKISDNFDEFLKPSKPRRTFSNSRSSSSARSYGDRNRSDRSERGERSDRRDGRSFDSRPSFSRRPSSGSRFSSSRSSFSSSGSRSRGRGPARGQGISVDLLVSKAVPSAEQAYTSSNSFADFEMDKMLLANVTSKGYTTPSPIQDQAIPVGLSGKDIIGIANTGTGKTAAFLIPIINTLIADRDKKAIILAPTRELAQQINEEFRSFTFNMRLYSAVCVGGASIIMQMRQLSRSAHIIIGTPGRVLDLINRGKIKLGEYHIAVLDEADRMLDMGFVDDMRDILHKMPAERQNFFFSATFSSEIRNLCKEFLKDPTTIEIKSRPTAENINQDVVYVERGSKHKTEALHDILNKGEVEKAIIFCETKRHTDQLAEELQERGFKVEPLHGDMKNGARTRVVNKLKNGELQAVVATDVAARGIDIKDITHVINYDMPQNYETYIHRIGRTGRAGKLGNALTFVNK
jgi:ATP-dependent RNA helicase RhlE